MRHSAQQSDRFTLALKGAKCGIWDWNLTEDTLYFDPNYFLIAGYEPDDFPHIYDEWKKRVHPEDVALVEKSIQQYLRGEINAFSIEFKFKTKSGDWMWILGQAEIVDRDKDGNPVRLSGLHIDITERKHAEIELRKSEQKYRLLADHNFNWEYWTNPQEGYHYISPSCERISGYRPDEFSANPQLMIDIVIPEHKNIVLQHSKDAHKKNTTPPAAPIEFQIITKNGEKLWLEHSCAAVFDEEGNYAGRRGSNRDISKRKQAEEEREQLLQAIDQSIEAIIIADDKGIIQYVNSAFEKITGYASEEAIGQNPRILKSGKHDEAFYQKMWESLKSGKTWAGQLINKKKDGTLYTDEATISPVLNNSGKTVNYVAVKHDITDKIKAEEQRQELETQLNQKFKIEAVGLMAGGMAHNFNNNLAIILGNIELLLLKKNTDKIRLHARLNDMKTAAVRSRDLIQNILIYSRQGTHDRLPVQLTLIITETLKLLQATIPTTVRMEQKIHPDNQGITINADSSQIQEILINLCNNAIHAMKEQGTLTIALDTAKLQTQDIPPQYEGLPGFYAKLSVQDTGTGMTEETMTKIFDPFFTTKNVDEGTGMGLATVHGIMNQHQGLIKVSSIPGQGSIFNLYFPLLEEQQAAPPATVNLTRGTERILIVDDEERLATASSQMLMEYGYEVTAMISSMEALERFKTNPNDFDLVISDQTMPNLSGEDLIKELLRIRPELPTILCTGYSNVIDNEKAEKIGIKAFLMKPYDMSTLILTTRQVLDKVEAG